VRAAEMYIQILQELNKIVVDYEQNTILIINSVCPEMEKIKMRFDSIIVV